MIRRVGPVAKVIYKAVLLGILMDVDHQVSKVSVGRDLDATKRSLKKRTRAVVGLVECLGVSIEKVGKVLTGLLKT